MKRIVLGSLFAVALGGFLMVATPAARSADDKTHEKHHAHLIACAAACAECQIQCDSCAQHCARLVADGKKEHLTTVRSCQDCADICRTAAASSARGGPYVKDICEMCAKICEACAKECERFPSDKHMAECARECRECEKACREMIKHLGA